MYLRRRRRIPAFRGYPRIDAGAGTYPAQGREHRPGQGRTTSPYAANRRAALLIGVGFP